MNHAGNPESDARQLYTDRREAAAEEVAHWLVRERWVSRARLATFVVGLLLGWMIFGSHQLATAWIFPPVGLFVILIVIHDRVIRKRFRAERTLDFYERGLNRINHTWAGQGESGDFLNRPGHPYADDLDLFGEGSVFELICTARTRAGKETLAQWLLEPSSCEEIAARQEAVRELTPRVALREALWLIGAETPARPAQGNLETWATAPLHFTSRTISVVAAFLTSLTLVAVAGWIWSGIGLIPVIAALGLQSAFGLLLRGRVSTVLGSAESPGHELILLSHLLALIESEKVESRRLLDLQSTLRADGAPPSKRISGLRRLLDLLDAPKNQFFAPIGALLLWKTHVAVALEAWRSRSGPGLQGWIDSAAEVEALCALAGYAYENPDYIYPELTDSEPCFEGTQLGHPLISPAQCVSNDLALGGERQVLMMSGSNMSGKSTMLRTVGCAAVLAMAGAPVRARSLRLSPLQVAASIRISDSLQQGISHFLAEVQRLAQVVDLTQGEWPVLFLLDEVLHGTNSHDRRIGAGALVRGLLEKTAIGIITTHDLALAELAGEEPGRVENVHFEDQMVDGRMAFDYRLREGVVTHSNALELMRSVGLDV